MLKKIILLTVLGFSLNACVSKKVYQELETKFNNLRTSNADLLQQNDSLLSSKKLLEHKLEELNSAHSQLNKAKEALQLEMEALEAKYANLDESYKVLASKSTKDLAEQSQKNQELRNQLNEKEQQLEAESLRLQNLQNELNIRSAKIDELENLIQAKELQMQQLKNAISSALKNFEGKGLTVVQKNGKIYVSMENKLLFGSGSWAVGAEGKSAIEQLADVLLQNSDIQVLIEGHTDTVPFKSGELLDNWDLSMKRSTAVVRILQNKGVNPTQMTAAGRSEFVPVATNSTADGKAKNRRIEIILAPNLDEISKLLNE
jgi:chemotaxis protein MotB